LVFVRRLSRFLVWLFIFSVPWGIVVNALPGLGSMTRLLGLVATGAGVLTAVVGGRIRKPGVIFWFAVVYTVASVLSLTWTISYPYSLERVETYIQFLGLVWLVREFAQTRREQHSFLLAFCLGAFAVAVNLFWNFLTGGGLQSQPRYSATDISPNYAGFALVIGFPMAWQLYVHRRETVRLMGLAYCLVAPIAVVLTASRTSLLAGFVVLSIVPVTVRRESSSWVLKVMLALCVAAVTIGLIVPSQTWDRILTTKQEIEEGTLGGRGRIWDAGWPVLQERPVLGVGAGAFPAAVEPALHKPTAAHNMVLCLLVEQGIVGFCLFVCLLGACVWTITRLPPNDRWVWGASIMAWLVFTVSSDSQADKVTWVLFGLLAAHGDAGMRRRSSPIQARVETDASALRERLRPAYIQMRAAASDRGVSR
jgi:O-antigen ligase